MPNMLHKFGLEFNPFEPSAAGPPLKGAATARSRWANMDEWRLEKASSCSRIDSD